MERSALLDLATRVGCPPAQDRHRLDCLVRWLLAHGWDGDEITVCAGIGTLTIGPGVQRWEPAIRAPRAEPLAAAPDVRAARTAACAGCDRYVAERCTVGGCGCAGLGRPERLHSKCPLGRWP